MNKLPDRDTAKQLSSEEKRLVLDREGRVWLKGEVAAVWESWVWRAKG